MPKVIVTDPKGYFFQKKKHPKDTELNHPPGPPLDAALHFKQVKVVAEEKAPPKK